MQKLFITTALALLIATPAFANDGNGANTRGPRDSNSSGGANTTLTQQWTARLNYQYAEYQSEEAPHGIKGYHYRGWVQAAQNLAKIASGKPVKSIPMQPSAPSAPLPSIY